MLNPDFRDILSAFITEDVEFLVVGAYALAESDVVFPIDGLDIPVIGRDDLIRNKRALGRTKDLADIEALEAE
ncbi:MAG: hypothetical protein R6U63_07040 [Longimicrobiales bacterium]